MLRKDSRRRDGAERSRNRSNDLRVHLETQTLFLLFKH